MFHPARTDPGTIRVAELLRRSGCVYAEDEAAILIGSATNPDHLSTMVAQRSRGVPIEHVVGWAEFCGLRVIVHPGVFIPRRRSEYLAVQAVALAAARGPRPVVVDMCCGTGAIALAIRARLAAAEVYAADSDLPSVKCARANLGADVAVLDGDLFDALPAQLLGRVDVIVANAPYVPSAAVQFLPNEARVHERREALDGGPDGTDIHRRLADGCSRWLAAGGVLLVETSETLAPATMSIFNEHRLHARRLTDEHTSATVVIGLN